MLVEIRPYFVLGDLACNAAAGAVIGALMVLIVGPEWNMFVAMVIGTVVGTVLSIPLALLAAGMFGAMEVLVPVMTTGMATGMVVSAVATDAVLTTGSGAVLGLEVGVVVLIATYLANAVIRGKASRWTS